jgi:hypothetical protein
MSKVIRILVLGVALACPVYAGYIPNNVTASDNIPNGVTDADEIPNGITLVNLLLILL